MKRFFLIILSVLFLTCLLPVIPVSAEGYGDYHAGDIEIINTLIVDHGLNWGIWEKDKPGPPLGWTSRIGWTDEEGPVKRIYSISISGENDFKSKMVDLQGLSTLRFLTIVESSITGINLEGLSLLAEIDLHGNNKLASVKAGGLTSLTQFFSYGGNHLSSLDLSDSLNLSFLNCTGNTHLASLILHDFSNLTQVNLSGTAVTSLDVSKMQDLVSLHCSFCSLTRLKLGSHPFLTDMYCSGNPLGSLDVSGAGALKQLDCSNCYLTSLKLDKTAPYEGLDVSNNLFPPLPQDADITGQEIEWGTGDYNYNPQREKIVAEETPENFTGSGDRGVTFEDPDKETFICLRQEGEIVDEGNYQVQAGSTIIILKESYLKTLSVGTYRYTAEWNEHVGSFDLVIGVLGAEETKPTTTLAGNGKDKGIDVPVGEPYNFLPLALMLTGLVLLAAVMHLRTRRQSQGD